MVQDAIIEGNIQNESRPEAQGLDSRPKTQKHDTSTALTRDSQLRGEGEEVQAHQEGWGHTGRGGGAHLWGEVWRRGTPGGTRGG